MARTANSTSDSQQNRGVTFVTSQRGKELPIVAGYIFVCKDEEMKQFHCKTNGCGATLILKRDDGCVFNEGTLRHEHPPHDVALASLAHKNAMRRAARTKHEDATTRSVLMEANRHCPVRRRLSSDVRFVRRLRRGSQAPKKASDIVFSGELTRFVLFNTRENDIIVFFDPEMVQCRRPCRSFPSTGRSVGAQQRTISWSHATQFVKTVFRFLSYLASFRIKRRLPTRPSFHRSTLFH